MSTACVMHVHVCACPLHVHCILLCCIYAAPTLHLHYLQAEPTSAAGVKATLNAALSEVKATVERVLARSWFEMAPTIGWPRTPSARLASLRTQRAAYSPWSAQRPGASVGAGQPVPERPRDEDSPLPSHQAVTGFAESRASKMDHDDFMRLLAQFNQAGVHFSS